MSELPTAAAWTEARTGCGQEQETRAFYTTLSRTHSRSGATATTQTKEGAVLSMLGNSKLVTKFNRQRCMSVSEHDLEALSAASGGRGGTTELSVRRFRNLYGTHYAGD